MSERKNADVNRLYPDNLQSQVEPICTDKTQKCGKNRRPDQQVYVPRPRRADILQTDTAAVGGKNSRLNKDCRAKKGSRNQQTHGSSEQLRSEDCAQTVQQMDTLDCAQTVQQMGTPDYELIVQPVDTSDCAQTVQQVDTLDCAQTVQQRGTPDCELIVLQVDTPVNCTGGTADHTDTQHLTDIISNWTLNTSSTNDLLTVCSFAMAVTEVSNHDSVSESHHVNNSCDRVVKDMSENSVGDDAEEVHNELVGTETAFCHNNLPVNDRLAKQENLDNCLVTVDNVSVDNMSGDNKAMDESSTDDDWDKMFDETGESLTQQHEEHTLKKSAATSSEVKISKPAIDYYSYQLREPDINADDYGHLLEICDFPTNLQTCDLLAAFIDFKDKGFDIKWVDDTHAIGIFASPVAASSALSSFCHPLMKVHPINMASRQTKLKVKRAAEFMQPYKPRPETTGSVARNLIVGALGLRNTNVPKQKKDEERRKLREAKDRKREAVKLKDDAWNGSITS